MPRINIDDELRADPRFHALSNLIGRPLAFGVLVCLWELGQAYWKKDRSGIPFDLAERLPNAAELIRTGFAVRIDDKIYCSGADEHWNFLLQRSEAGKKSAIMRQEKYGSAIPHGASNNRTGIRTAPNETEPSPLLSSDLIKKEEIKETTEAVSEPLPIDLLKLWNSNCEPFSKAKEFTAGRKKIARSQLLKYPEASHWRDVLERWKKSTFCREQWRPNFDDFLKESKRIGTLEGKYDDRSSNVRL